MRTTARNALIGFLFMSFIVLPMSWADSIDEGPAATTTASSPKEEAATQPARSGSKQEAVAQPVSQSANTGTAEPATTSPVTGPTTPAPSAATVPQTEKKSAQTKIAVGGGAFFLDRHNYRLIQHQNENQLAGYPVGDPFEYDRDGLGSFGNVAVEQPIWGNISLGGSFLGAALENHQSRQVPGGTSTGQNSFTDNASVIPLLNENGKAAGLGSAVEIGGKPNDHNALADTNFEYDTQQYDVAVDAIWNKLCACHDLQVDGLIGFGYTRINQNSELDTQGINNVNNGIVRTKTIESIHDDLFGGRVGIRLHKSIIPKLSVFTKLVGGFYGDSIHYKGVQEFSNALFVGYAPVENFSLEENQGTTRFVPRLESVTGVAYRITTDLTAAVAYRFNAFWEASTIDHPTVRFNNQSFAANSGQDVIDHPVRIGSETVTQHYIEVKLAYKF